MQKAKSTIQTPSLSGNEKCGRVAQHRPSATKAAVADPKEFGQLISDRARKAFTKRQIIRPGVVARARDLASDPAYPSDEVISKVAEAILQASGRFKAEPTRFVLTSNARRPWKTGEG